MLLRSLDGFTRGRYIVIGATNRTEDLDKALRSRFSISVFFGLPDAETRSTPLLLQALSPEALFSLHLEGWAVIEPPCSTRTHTNMYPPHTLRRDTHTHGQTHTHKSFAQQFRTQAHPCQV